MSKISKLGSLILLAICAYGLYLFVYPVTKIFTLTSTDIVIVVLCLIGVILSLKILLRKNKKAEVPKPAEFTPKELFDEIKPIPRTEEISVPKEEEVPKLEPYKIEVIQNDKPIKPIEVRSINNEDVFDRLKEISQKRTERFSSREELNMGEEELYDEILGTDSGDETINMDKVVSSFNKSINKLMDQLDKETMRLEKEKEKADKVHNNIQDTVKKLHGAHLNLKNTRERLDKMIRTNKMLKENINMGEDE